MSKKTETDTAKKISKTAFDDVVGFYNENEALFVNFKKKIGINLWFLSHLRTYFSYRNLLLKEKVATTNYLTVRLKEKPSIITLFWRIVYEFLGMLVKYKSPQKNDSKYVIISNASDLIEGKNKRFNGLDYDMLHNRVLFDVKNKISWREFTQKKMMNSDGIFLAYIFRFYFISDLFKFHRHLNCLLKKISRQDTLKKQPKHRSIFFFFAKNRPFFYLSYLRFRSFDLFFRKSNIKGILLSDENSPQQKVIQYAASRNKIHIFGFQHGNIHTLHPAYIYGNYKTKPLLPNITFTWGTYFSELLHKQGGYPKNSVKPVGRIPPYDTARKINSSINTEDNILLYASQPQRNADVRHKMLADILSVVKQLSPRYKLVIRPHPRETDDDFFNKVANDVGFQDFIIDRTTDLKTHFEICSILVVAFSTVGTEFIPYFKPLLVLDYLNQDLINWIEQGVGKAIRSRQELLEFLYSEDLKINIISYKKFLEKYYSVGDTVLEKVKKAMYGIP